MTPTPKITFSTSQSKLSAPQINFPDPYEDLKRKNEYQTNVIIAVFVVALITMIFMGATLVIDSFHFNSATYKEYSQKTEVLSQLNETNKQLLEQNKQLQQQIVDLFSEIKTILTTKK